MASKDKVSDKSTKTTTPVEKELNAATVKDQLEEKVEYHNNLIKEKERLLGELNKVESALNQSIGTINTLNGLHQEFFVEETISVNGEA